MEGNQEVHELFSVRQRKAANSGRKDVYQYDALPPRFRAQVVYIWMAAIGPWAYKEEFVYDTIDEGHTEYHSNPYWPGIHDQFVRDVGLLDLTGTDKFEKLKQFFLGAETTDCLDLIDLTFHVVDTDIRWFWNIEQQAREFLAHEGQPTGTEIVSQSSDFEDGPTPGYSLDELEITQTPDEAIAELNRRFREHSIGYEFVGRQLMRVDALYVHQEMVKPAITLLQDEAFEGASSEFLRAHEHYRHGRNKEAIVEAAKAFESVLKTLCDLSGWHYQTGDTAQRLIEIVLSNGLIDRSLQSHFTGIRATLDAGLPTIRNRTSAHGQGSQTVDVPEFLTAYAIHLASAAIIMLVEAYNARKI